MRRLHRLVSVSAVSVSMACGLVAIADDGPKKPEAGERPEISLPADAHPGRAWIGLDALPRGVDVSRNDRVRPARFRAVRFDVGRTAQVLKAAPAASDLLLDAQARADVEAAPFEVSLPGPDGEERLFNLVYAPVMAPELAAKFPEIRTYRGIPADGSGGSAQITVTPEGVHAQVLDPKGAWYIDPYDSDDTSLHAVYHRRDYRAMHRWVCEVEDEVNALNQPAAINQRLNEAAHDGEAAPTTGDEELGVSARLSGETLQTYRIAISANGQYSAFHGNTIGSVTAAIVTGLARVNGVYESEVAIRMVLVGNNDQLICLSPCSFLGNSASSLINANQSYIDSRIGSGAYDIGHVFSTGGGGIASLGSVCSSANKARGVTGLPAPVNDPFLIDYVAHEIGHQFGATHTFNGVSGSCFGGNRTGSTAFEPGSGNTIMAYAGICGSDNVQSNSIPIFHSASYDQMRSFITNGNGRFCDVPSATGNSAPIVDAGPNYNIPAGTPFTLTATGSDPNGDDLTFAWEQRDLGPAAALSAADDGQIPLFIALSPTTDPSRTFPNLNDILAGVSNVREKLPTQSRQMQFRVTARDNRAGGGGVARDNMAINVTNTGSAFSVISPNGGETVGGPTTVEWDVAGTNNAPINTTSVDILLSTDGGQTFPVTLISGTPNDGSETVLITGAVSSQARIKIQPTNSVYFAISDNNFVVDSVPISIAAINPPTLIDPDTPTQIAFEIADSEEMVDGTTPTLFTSINSGPFVASPLVNINGEWLGTLPPVLCEETLEYYAEATSTLGSTVSFPEAGSASPVGVAIGNASIGFLDDFGTDQGWTNTSDATEGTWERGVPVANGRADPFVDFDGNGICYLTENDPVDINSDVDNGCVTLISPVFDFSGGGTISYAYWFSDSGGAQFSPEDRFTVETSNDGGMTWRSEVTYTTSASFWREDTRVISAVDGGPTFQVRFTVCDEGSGSLVEGALDAFAALGSSCVNPAFTCLADYNGDGLIDTFDTLDILADLESGSLDGDYNSSGTTDAADLLAFLIQFELGCD